MKTDYNLKIISGLHRSGTTYLGKIIDQDPDINVIREPFNPDWGVTNVSQWYPHLEFNGVEEKPETKELFEDIYQFRREWTKKPPRKLKIPSHLLKLAVGGKEGLNYSGLKIRKYLNSLPSTVCWKDPFVTFSIDYLTKTYDAKAICLVRHPGAFWHSNARLNWSFDISRISSQTTLVEQYVNDILQQYWDSATSETVVSLAILWKLMARVIKKWSDTNESILVVRHEDLCLKPLETAATICEHLEIEFTDVMEQYIQKTTQNSKVEASENIAHDFKRNSKAVANSWRNKISRPDVYKLQNIIGDDFNTFYSAW